ncbi:hypothetical protein OF83DRAFT_1268311, partial [Amylostereum chailletii]
MVSWTDPALEAANMRALGNVVAAFFSLYGWELFQTCEFEWSLLKGRRKFHWSLVFFLGCRYTTFWALFAILVLVSTHQMVHCEALHTFSVVTGNFAVLTASTSLMLRTIHGWRRHAVANVLILVMCLVHWGLLLRAGFATRATWSASDSVCVLTTTDSPFLQLGFWSTMLFYLAVVALMIIRTANSDLRTLLFTDGLAFYAVPVVVNVLPAVFGALN